MSCIPDYEEKHNEFLDTIDILKYFKMDELRHNDLYAMMDYIKKFIDYPYKCENVQELFDSMSEDEFKDYLNKRYPKELYVYTHEVFMFNVL